jgi:hypothetical protein
LERARRQIRKIGEIMKKIIYILCVLLFSAFTYSAEKVKVFVQPSAPIVNEPFDLVFKVKLEGDQEPYISFDPGRFEVLGKSNQGVSIKTTIVNGKFTTKKEVTVVYSMQTSSSGINLLRGIEVDFGNNVKEKLRTLRINVLREPKRAKDIFVLAVPSKTDVYVGEGFDVNYYLYFKVGVLGNEVEKYPPLSKFLKRFHMVNEVVETVRYQGEMYRRSLKYSARLFAQKPGEATIDPLKLKVQYSSSRNRGAFGFGLQLGQYRTRSFLSKKVKINVMSLPTDNVPPYFTGLVGKHEYKLSIPRNKYLVNEAIEAKLEVEGVGALEAFDPPKIYSHESLEEFDTKGEIQAVNNQVQKKIFEYTYLPRAAFQLPPNKLKIAYFDPDQKVYVTTEVDVPEMIVSGTGVSARSFSTPEKREDEAEQSNEVEELKKVGLVGIGLGKNMNSSITPFRVNGALIVVLFITLISFFLRREQFKTNELSSMIKKCLSGNVTYSGVYTIVNLLPGGVELTAREKLQNSGLSEDAKTHFSMLMDALEVGTYSKGDKQSLKPKKKYFHELKHLIEK